MRVTHAWQFQGGVLVVSVFVQQAAIANAPLAPIVDVLSKINNGDTATATSFDLFSLVYPALTGTVFNYKFDSPCG